MMETSVKEPRRSKSNLLVDGVIKTSLRVRGTTRSNKTPRISQVRFFSRFLLVTMLFCLGSIVWLSQTSTLVSLSYDISKMEKQKAQLDTDAQRLQSQIAEYESLQRVEEEAKSKLGMVPAKNSIYVSIPASKPDNAPASTNPNLAPTTDWWQDLKGMLPQQTKNPDATPGS